MFIATGKKKKKAQILRSNTTAVAKWAPKYKTQSVKMLCEEEEKIYTARGNTDLVIHGKKWQKFVLLRL